MSKSQCDLILADLKKGHVLTPFAALRQHKVMRLAARIYELRESGYDIRSKLVRKGDVKWSAYWMPR